MNWGAIGAVADLLASCGVIASLVFLAIQIRNNSKVTRLSLRESYITGHNQIFERIMENPDVYRLWRLGTASPDEMNDDEQERFGILLYSIFNQFLIAFQSSQIDSSIAGGFAELVGFAVEAVE